MPTGIATDAVYVTNAVKPRLVADLAVAQRWLA
jgi:hypothetical protein